MRNLNLDHLSTFAEVISSGSFSKAAAKLDITQPAVSLQIRALEKRLNVRLIERIGKRALPTSAGRDLLGFGQRLEQQAEAAIAHMRGYQSGRTGRLRIGSGASACIYLLPQVLAAVQASYPGIEIRVITGNTLELLDAVEKNTVDLAMVTLPASRRSLSVRPIFEDALVGIFPVSERLPARVRPHSFSNRTLILFETGSGIRKLIEEWFAATGAPVKPAMEFGDVEAIKHFVAAGLGGSIVPGIAVSKSDPSYTIRPLAPGLIRKLGIATRRDKVVEGALRAAVKAFEKLSG